MEPHSTNVRRHNILFDDLIAFFKSKSKKVMVGKKEDPLIVVMEFVYNNAPNLFQYVPKAAAGYTLEEHVHFLKGEVQFAIFGQS